MNRLMQKQGSATAEKSQFFTLIELLVVIATLSLHFNG